MIAKLRARHRWMSALMGVVSLGGLGVALASRVAPPVMPTLPAPVSAAALPAGPPLSVDEALWTGASIRTARYAEAVVLSPLEPLRMPDPLVYLAASAPAGEALPQGARLLGSLSDAANQPFPVPANAQGHLIVYSLAHDRVVAHAALGAR